MSNSSTRGKSPRKPIPESIASSIEAGHAREPQATIDAFRQLPALLSAAPHRLMFFAGALAVMVSMLWWALYLGAAEVGSPFPIPSIPPGWAHAVLTQYGMLPPFMFGFLLTVFPRWMNHAPLTRRDYVPVFLGVFGGYLLANVGLLGLRPLLIAGLALMLTGWAFGLAALGRILFGARGRDRHALSCFTALLLGFCGLAAFAAFTLGASPSFGLAAIKIGTFGLLLPIYFTVCHRMVPFFSASVVGARYRVIKPAWSLPLLWLLLIAHLVLDLSRKAEWLWIADLPLAVFFLFHWIAWQPWKCLRPGLLAALHIASAWLPIAFLMYATQSLMLFMGEGSALGRAPVHALTIGFFGSMLVAMVTRVTQGHSGRPLQMGGIAWLTFALLQIVTLTRIHAEFSPDQSKWLVIAAFAWLIAFLPWVLRSLWIFLTPRIDGEPG